MTDTKRPPEKNLEDRVRELVRGIFEVLEQLVPAPEPILVPVRARARRRPRR